VQPSCHPHRAPETFSERPDTFDEGGWIDDFGTTYQACRTERHIEHLFTRQSGSELPAQGKHSGEARLPPTIEWRECQRHQHDARRLLALRNDAAQALIVVKLSLPHAGQITVGDGE
jgi:hypothetical protein